MAESSTLLGLFPISAVLFPMAQLPLHIFEERYKQLINGCITTGEEFGINLMDDQKVHEIGCSARVVDVVTRYPDGRLDIVIQGMRRYRVGPLDSQSHPYLVTNVEWLDDTDDDVDVLLLRRVLDMYNELVETVYGGSVETLDVEDIEGDPSFKMAQKAGLEIHQRQHLLTMGDENDRLKYIEDYFSEVLPKIREAERIQGIIRNDGYL